MKKQLLLTSLLLILASCGATTTSSSSNSGQSSIILDSQTSDDSTIISSDTSEEQPSISIEESSSSETSSSEKVEEVDLPGYEKHLTWPAELINSYINNNEEPPVLESGYNYYTKDVNYHLQIEVRTRLANQSVFDNYLSMLSNDYDYSVEFDNDASAYYVESKYDDVRGYLSLDKTVFPMQASLLFFGGDPKPYTGYSVVDNLAHFDLTTKNQLNKATTEKATWEVRPVTMSLTRNGSGNAVGNINGEGGEHLANPLRVYERQTLVFKTNSSRYSIEKIVIQPAGGWSPNGDGNKYFDVILDAQYTNAVAVHDNEKPHLINLIPTGDNVKEITYTTLPATSQTRLLDIKVYLVDSLNK